VVLGNWFFADSFAAELENLYDISQNLEAQDRVHLDSLVTKWSDYCMGDTTFDGHQLAARLKVGKDVQAFKQAPANAIQSIFERTLNMRRFRLTLPLQLLDTSCTSATQILATTLKALAQRVEDSKPLETLVIDNLNGYTVRDICFNPQDLGYMETVVQKLKNLIISFKVFDEMAERRAVDRGLWYIIRRASDLESLCITGWCEVSPDRRTLASSLLHTEWFARSIPYVVLEDPATSCIRFLQLQRVQVTAPDLVRMFQDMARSLKEVYLCDVYVKIHGANDIQVDRTRWVGDGGATKSPDDAYWIAERLAQISELNLSILRASGLGYDEFEFGGTDFEVLDIEDPDDLGRSLDERFVEVVMNKKQIANLKLSQEEVPKQNSNSSVGQTSNTALSAKLQSKTLVDYDANSFLEKVRNLTSKYQHAIDDVFACYNDKAMKELNTVLDVATDTMKLLSLSIENANQMGIDAETGALVAR
jgi:hypothetical protein